MASADGKEVGGERAVCDEKQVYEQARDTEGREERRVHDKVSECAPAAEAVFPSPQRMRLNWGDRGNRHSTVLVDHPSKCLRG